MASRVVVIGTGVVGGRTAARLRSDGFDVDLVSGRAGADLDPPPGVVVLATPSTTQPALARQAVQVGASVVTTADEPGSINELWNLDHLARRADCRVVVGSGFSPGVTSLLVGELVRDMDRVESITTARFGTGGPACAREHHRSMAASGWEVRQGIGRWVRGGSGRTLVWFPEPVGPKDCYRAGLAEPELFQKLYPHAARIQALQAATRRDRLTARLPMLRPPHPEGLEGGGWAEVRGVVGGRVEHRVLAAIAPQATGAAEMAAATTRALLSTDPDLDAFPGLAASPQCGVVIAADLAEPAAMLAEMAPKVRVFGYDGSVAERSESRAPVRAARKRLLPLKSDPTGR